MILFADSLSAQILHQEMEAKEKSLFENICFSSALFLDPRFKNTISEAKLSLVKEHLYAIWKRVTELQSAENDDIDSENNADEDIENGRYKT